MPVETDLKKEGQNLRKLEEKGISTQKCLVRSTGIK